jgi:hypothetical protein
MGAFSVLQPAAVVAMLLGSVTTWVASQAILYTQAIDDPPSNGYKA